MAGVDDLAVLAWGDATALGYGSCRDPIAVPRRLAAFNGHRVTFVAAGEGFSAAITAAGHLYLWGVGKNGQLAQGPTVTQLAMPELVASLADHVVTLVSCGHSHIACCTATGALFTWGDGSHGKLGLGTTQSVGEPSRVDSFPRSSTIAKVSCGADHTMALTHDGVLYTWGGCTWGQCGHAALASTLSGSHCPLPRRIDLFSPPPPSPSSPAHEEKTLPLPLIVTDIAAGGWHSMAVVAGGGLFAWGRGQEGQCGMGDGYTCTTPVQNPYFPGEGAGAGLGTGAIGQVVCGWYHTLVLTREGNILAWGLNQHGQCGSGRLGCEYVPVAIASIHGMHALAAGRYHSLAIGRQGQVYQAGRLNHRPISLQSRSESLLQSQSQSLTGSVPDLLWHPVQGIPGGTLTLMGAAASQHALLLSGSRSDWMMKMGSCLGGVVENVQSTLPSSTVGVLGTSLPQLLSQSVRPNAVHLRETAPVPLRLGEYHRLYEAPCEENRKVKAKVGMGMARPTPISSSQSRLDLDRQLLEERLRLQREHLEVKQSVQTRSTLHTLGSHQR